MYTNLRKHNTHTRLNIPSLFARLPRIREPPEEIYTTTGELVPNPEYKKSTRPTRAGDFGSDLEYRNRIINAWFDVSAKRNLRLDNSLRGEGPPEEWLNTRVVSTKELEQMKGGIGRTRTVICPTVICEIPPPLEATRAFEKANTKKDTVPAEKKDAEKPEVEDTKGKGKESEFVTEQMREKIRTSVMALREGILRAQAARGVKRAGGEEPEHHPKRRAAERINGIEGVALDSD